MKFSETTRRLSGKKQDFPYLAAFAKFRHCGSRKMAVIDGFQPLSGILIIQSTSYVLYKLANWVFRSDLNWGYVRLISALWRPEMAPILMVSDHYLEYWSLNPLHIGVCTVYESLQIWIDIWPQDHFLPSGGQKNGSNRLLSTIIWNTDTLQTG